MATYSITYLCEIMTLTSPISTHLLLKFYPREYHALADQLDAAIRERLHLVSKQIIVTNSAYRICDEFEQVLIEFDINVDAPETATDEQLSDTLAVFTRASCFDVAASDLDADGYRIKDGVAILATDTLAVKVRER